MKPPQTKVDKKVRILIADDHGFFRFGLKWHLSQSMPQAVIEEAESAEEVLKKAAEGSWNIFVIDISMPGRTGLDILPDLAKLQPRTPVLFLSGHPEEQFALRAIRAGASGYVSKANADLELVGAVQKVLSGGIYVTGKQAESLARMYKTGQEKPPHETISERELEVLLLIAKGRSVKEISGILGVSPQTVSTHRARLMDKMELESDAALVRYALEKKLID
jgi:two-component system, NarL family, invasion response regulator UvrY